MYMYIAAIYEGVFSFFFFCPTYLSNVNLALPVLDDCGRWLLKHDFLA